MRPRFRLPNWRLAPRLRSAQPLKIGVALGGGFARGIAHIGVLEVFEQERIPIDYIAGTSSGSIIAAAFAAGLRAADIAQAASKLRMRDIGRWTVSLLGLSSNACMENFLRRLLPCIDFAQMHIPLLITATDMQTGNLAVFREGNVCDAVRASCAYPLMYQPVKIGDRLYLDGGLVCAVPSEPLREAGATRVIGVELTPHWTSTSPRNMLEVLGQSMSIAIMTHAHAWRAASDILVQPEISGVAYDAFHRWQELIESGRMAAREALPKIRSWLEEAPQTALAPEPVLP